jgi:hypothetical protein
MPPAPQAHEAEDNPYGGVGVFVHVLMWTRKRSAITMACWCASLSRPESNCAHVGRRDVPEVEQHACRVFRQRMCGL